MTVATTAAGTMAVVVVEGGAVREPTTTTTVVPALVGGVAATLVVALAVESPTMAVLVAAGEAGLRASTVAPPWALGRICGVCLPRPRQLR